MIEHIWKGTFNRLEQFTHELEKEKSYVALQEMKPLWRIMKSIQLKYLPTLPEDIALRLDKMIDRLELRDIAASAWDEKTATALMNNLSLSCSIDPVSLGDE